jgi:hypothetical protein
MESLRCEDGHVICEPIDIGPTIRPRSIIPLGKVFLGELVANVVSTLSGPELAVEFLFDTRGSGEFLDTEQLLSVFFIDLTETGESLSIRQHGGRIQLLACLEDGGAKWWADTRVSRAWGKRGTVDALGGGGGGGMNNALQVRDGPTGIVGLDHDVPLVRLAGNFVWSLNSWKKEGQWAGRVRMLDWGLEGSEHRSCESPRNTQWMQRRRKCSRVSPRERFTACMGGYGSNEHAPADRWMISFQWHPALGWTMQSK